ncbi:Gfo/Idh/MocA family oxidoreductase [Thermostilla marina]
MGVKLRIGIIGFGNGAHQRYLAALRTLVDRLEVRAVCEPIACRVAETVSADPVRLYAGFRAMCRDPNVDAVVVLDTAWFGPLPILAACDEAKAVFLGKDVVLTPDELRRVRDRVATAGVAFMAELPRRHYPATIRLKELIATRLGPPRLLFCHDRIPPRNPRPGRLPNGGLNLQRHAAELVDWCTFVMGQGPRRVTATRCRAPVGDDSHLLALTLDFGEVATSQSGPIAMIDCAHSSWEPWQEALSYRPPPAMKVVCEHGVAYLDPPTTLVWFDQAGQHIEALEQEVPLTESMLMIFYRMVTSLIRRMTDIDDLCRAVQVVDIADRSAAEGRRLELPKT